MKECLCCGVPVKMCNLGDEADRLLEEIWEADAEQFVEHLCQRDEAIEMAEFEAHYSGDHYGDRYPDGP